MSVSTKAGGTVSRQRMSDGTFITLFVAVVAITLISGCLSFGAKFFPVAQPAQPGDQ